MWLDFLFDCRRNRHCICNNPSPPTIRFSLFLVGEITPNLHPRTHTLTASVCNRRHVQVRHILVRFK